MNLTFLNHVSFILSTGNSNILFDPYLYGSAFNNVWKLLNEEEHDVTNVNYIFYSHEHPDHFQVDFLKKNSSGYFYPDDNLCWSSLQCVLNNKEQSIKSGKILLWDTIEINK